MKGFDKAVAMEIMTNEEDVYKKFMYGYIRLKEENARLRKGIEEMIDDIDNGYISDATSCADNLRGLIE